MKIRAFLFISGAFAACLISAGVRAETLGPSVSSVSAAFECGKSDGVKDAEAGQLIDKVQRAYDGLRTLTAQFEQESHVKALELSEQSSGDVIFLKPGKMKWHYTAPEEQIFVIRNETLWLYQPAQNQVVIDAFRNVLISDLPVSFLMGIGGIKEKFAIKKACRSGERLLFTLTPKGVKKDDRRASLERFVLAVDAATFLPSGAQVFDIGGNITTILFHEIHADREIAEKRFELSFPAGTDVNDRRRENAVVEKPAHD